MGDFLLKDLIVHQLADQTVTGDSLLRNGDDVSGAEEFHHKFKHPAASINEEVPLLIVEAFHLAFHFFI